VNESVASLSHAPSAESRTDATIEEGRRATHQG
jgi:hypothetical protein